MNCTNCWGDVPGGSAQCPECGTPMDTSHEDWAREEPEQRPRSQRRRRIRRLVLATMLAVAATFGFRAMRSGTVDGNAALVAPLNGSDGSDATDATVTDTSGAPTERTERATSGGSPLTRRSSVTAPTRSTGSTASPATERASAPEPDPAIAPYPTVRPRLLTESLASRTTRATAVVRVGGDVKMPVKMRDVDPTYPRIARVARVKGGVVLEAVIDTDGRVTDVRVVKSVRLLDEAALDAVGQWRYEPARLNGIAVPVVATITVTFSL